MAVKNKYIINFSELFEQGQLKKVVGRKKEIERVSQVLMRLTKNNPLLIGAIGIGKTSIVEGFAAVLAKNEVPEMLKNKIVVQLDTASMLMESASQSDYEENLRKAFLEIEESKGQMILFIKDATFFSRAYEANKDIAKYLKPKIVNGSIKCIIATDLTNFKLHLESDTDLMRIIQPIYIEEPTMAETIEILIGTKNHYESYFDIKIPNETIKMAVELSQRFIKQRLFPEKAIDLLDEASSLLKVDLASGTKKPDENLVTSDYVSKIISFWTGVPLEKIGSADKERLLNMESFLEKRVIGQPEAVKVIAGAVRRSKSGLQDPNRPLGTFLFIGTTGVGKTELAKALAEFVFDDETALLRLDMSEYMERDSVKRLLGPPPGSPGYENGGILTEAVRLRPYQVVLFDELEKANGEILNLLLQVLDEGRLTDSKGLTVDFRNTIIIMTSNIGANLPKYQRMEHLKKAMKPEFLARIDDIVPFQGLQPAKLIYIVEIHLNKLIKRAKAKDIFLNITLEAKKWLSEEVYVAKNGVRELKRLLQHNVENPVAELIMQDKVLPGYTVTVDVSGNKLKITKIESETPITAPQVSLEDAYKTPSEEAPKEESGGEETEEVYDEEQYSEEDAAEYEEGEEGYYEEYSEDGLEESSPEDGSETYENVPDDAENYDEGTVSENEQATTENESASEDAASIETSSEEIDTNEENDIKDSDVKQNVINNNALDGSLSKSSDTAQKTEVPVTPAVKIPPKPQASAELSIAKVPPKPTDSASSGIKIPPKPQASAAGTTSAAPSALKIPSQPKVVVKKIVKVVKPPEKTTPKPQ
ncbi:MAG: AAA family ATPase [Alphaproteobacteria bacterium]